MIALRVFAAQQPDAVGGADKGLDEGNQELLRACGFRGKNAGGVDHGMGENTGQNAAADMEHSGITEADGRCVDQLQQGVNQGFAQEKVYDVSRSKGQRGNDDGGFDTRFAHTLEQQSPEDDLLQKCHEAHADDVEDRFQSSCVDLQPVPKIDAGDDRQREKVKVVFSAARCFAKTKIPGKAMLADESIEQNAQHKSNKDRQQFGNANGFGKGIGIAETYHINNDPQDRKPYFILVKEFFHSASPPFLLSYHRAGELQEKRAVNDRPYRFFR